MAEIKAKEKALDERRARSMEMALKEQVQGGIPDGVSLGNFAMMLVKYCFSVDEAYLQCRKLPVPV